MKYVHCLKLLLPIFIFLSACQPNPLEIDVSHIKLEVDIHRLDQQLFEQNQDSIVYNVQKFRQEYDIFFQRYIENILGLGSINNPVIADSLKSFINDPYINELFNDVQKKYPDMLRLNKDFSDAFKHYKFYFPEKTIPKVVTFISGFNYALANTDSVLGIGLTMYLGSHYEHYEKLGFPRYKTANMNAVNILPDAVKGWISTEIEFDPFDKSLLENIIYHGKIMYILDAVLPKVEDSLKIGYSSEQLRWCDANEENIWAHFIDKELLFSTNYKEIMKYVSEGPFTPGLPRESPSRVGVWVGWQIVRSYMDKSSAIDLNKLLQENPMVILKASKYKPGK